MGKEKKPPKYKHMRVEEKKKMHIALKITLIVLAVIVLFIGSILLYINAKLDLIVYDNEVDDSVYSSVSTDTENTESSTEPDKEEEEIDVTEETEEAIVDIAGLEVVEDLPDAEELLNENTEETIYSDNSVMNILLIGTDERSNSFSTNARSDSMILVSINKAKNTVKLVSLERGMGVPILEGDYAGQYDWLTHIFRYGGANLLVKTVRTCFNLDLDKYVRVNFNSVRQVVDMIGGIDMYLSEAEANALDIDGTGYEEYTAGAGVYHLDGEKALSYARLRSIDSDWQRVARQRNVIMAVVQRMKNSNLFELDSLANAVLPLVQTNLSKWEIAELVMYVPSFVNSDFDQMTVPPDGTYGGMTGMGGRGMFAPDFELNSEILHDFIYG